MFTFFFSVFPHKEEEQTEVENSWDEVHAPEERLEVEESIEIALESDQLSVSSSNGSSSNVGLGARSSTSIRFVAGKDISSEQSNDSHSSNSDEHEASSQRSDDIAAFNDLHDDHQEDSEGSKFKNRYVRMGERLTDDLINAYCDRLQEAVNKEVDGMLAMQYIMLEPSLVKTLIGGDKPICQVIYDTHRVHYLVVYRKAHKTAPIIIYDPIIPHQDAIHETLNNSVCQQVATLFRHLYDEDEPLEIGIEMGLSPQQDCWSCGLRAVGHITHIVLGIHPVRYEYDLELVRDFFSRILDTLKPSRHIFESASLGKLRTDARSKLVMAKITRDGELLEEQRRSAGGEMLDARSELAVDDTQSDADSEEHQTRVVCF
ncbi:unnamed protein product [Toxocara canis]|uniref:Ubiquitin-like protease family profile domain-containing protein n=1 Tax=Toxocara canis TaxID=6265 RepID=A0A3P7F5D0_TOXCA|nr:unnamed protein product [Toxocara canis]